MPTKAGVTKIARQANSVRITFNLMRFAIYIVILGLCLSHLRTDQIIVLMVSGLIHLTQCPVPQELPCCLEELVSHLQRCSPPPTLAMTRFLTTSTR